MSGFDAIDQQTVNACVVCHQPLPGPAGRKYVLEMDGHPAMGAHTTCATSVTAAELIDKYQRAVRRIFGYGLGG